MKTISKFDELRNFCNECSNIYLKETIKEYFECLYTDEMNDKNNFDLRKIVNGNSSIIILENEDEVDLIVKEIFDIKNKLSWCIDFRINDDLMLSFYQIGLIRKKSYCSHYFIQKNILDKNLNCTINNMTTSSRMIY